MPKTHPLFLPSEPASMSLPERCRHYAEQIAEAEKDDSSPLELTEIRRTLEQAGEALT